MVGTSISTWPRMPKNLHEETVRKVLDLHKYDCARANKSMMAWGIEARVPFLDKSFIDYAMRLDPEAKMAEPRQAGKRSHPTAFEGLLPSHILRRQKSSFQMAWATSGSTH